jgi:hypothetical protein
LSVGALPRAGAPESLAPHTAGARHVVLERATDGEHLVFVARGHLMREPVLGGSAEVLDAGTVDAVWGPVVAAHGVILGQRIDARGVPTRPRRVDVLGGPSVPAHSFGVAAHAPVAIALDVVTGDVHHLDLAAKSARTLRTLQTRQAIEMPGLVSLTDDGTRAFVTVSSSAHEDAWLVELDLVKDTAIAVHAPVSKGSVTGTRWGKRLVVLEQLLGDDPRLRVLVDGRVLIARDGLHPLAPPVPLSDTHLLLLAVPKPDPISKSGEPQLCVLDASGTLVALAPAVGSRIRLDGRVVLVEDGRHITRVTLEG